MWIVIERSPPNPRQGLFWPSKRAIGEDLHSGSSLEGEIRLVHVNKSLSFQRNTRVFMPKMQLPLAVSCFRGGNA